MLNSNICPYCHAPIGYEDKKCKYCLKEIIWCPKCHSPMTSNLTTCLKCGSYLLDEPFLTVKIWIEGSVLVGDTCNLRIWLSNVGNASTKVNFSAKADKGIEPLQFSDVFDSLIPNTSIDKSYQFKIKEKSLINIQDIKIEYSKKKGGQETINLTPISFNTFGKPIAKLFTQEGNDTIKCVIGDETKVFFSFINEGSETISDMKISMLTPPGVMVKNRELSVIDVEPQMTKIGVFKIVPHFTGKYLCKIKGIYNGKYEQHPYSNINFESNVLNILLDVTMENDSIKPKKARPYKSIKGEDNV